MKNSTEIANNLLDFDFETSVAKSLVKLVYKISFIGTLLTSFFIGVIIFVFPSPASGDVLFISIIAKLFWLFGLFCWATFSIALNRLLAEFAIKFMSLQEDGSND
jgi:hypothetical protein